MRREIGKFVKSCTVLGFTALALLGCDGQEPAGQDGVLDDSESGVLRADLSAGSEQEVVLTPEVFGNADLTALVEQKAGTASYHWTQIDGPVVDITDSTAATAWFVAPVVTEDPVDVLIQLTVSADGEDITGIVRVTVSAGESEEDAGRRLGLIADAGPSLNVTEGDLVTLDGSGSTGSGEIRYEWNQMSGRIVRLSATAEPIVTFVAPAISATTETLSFALTVQQVDASAASAIDTRAARFLPKAKDNTTVTIVKKVPTDLPPQVNAGADQSITLPTDSVNLNGTVTSDGLPNPPGTVTVTWSKVSGAGNVTFGDTSAVDTVATFDSAGSYTLQLAAYDGASTTTDAVTITVNPAPNKAPVAGFVANPTSGQAPLTVSLDGSGSSDTDGTITSYEWDFGDGTTGSGAVLSHVYTSAGTYAAKLTVTDNGGLTGQSPSVSISVGPANQAPVASFGVAPIAGEAPVRVTLDGSASSDSDGSIVSHSWDFGDGATGLGATTIHQYSAAGKHTAKLTVTDNGSASASSTATVYVMPDVSIVPSVSGGQAPLVVDFSIGGGDPLAYLPPESTITWDFGDGTVVTGTAEQVSHTYSAVGSHAVVLTLVLAGGLGTIQGDSLTVQVSEASPGVLAVNPSDGLESAGDATGGFTPTSKMYTVTNTGQSPITWSASKTQAWVSLSKANGTLAAGASDAVVVSIGSAAGELAAGSHADAVTFANAESASNAFTRSVSLVVNASQSEGCLTSSATWQNTSFAAQSGTFTAEFDVVPGAAGIDGVIGLSDGARTAYSAFACLVRFNTSNTIDARNGETYPASTIGYTAGASYHIRMVVDVVSRTYNTYVTEGTNEEQTLGTAYVFRTNGGTPVAVGSLNNWGLASDPGTGTCRVCDFAVSTQQENQAPTVSAGLDQTVTLPNSANLDGTVTDDGLPSSPGAMTVTWSRVSGPGTVTFGNANSADTTATFTAAGTYVLQLTASDGSLSASDSITVTVQAAGTNQAPVVNAGADQAITLPTNSVSLDATVSDDGLPSSPGAVTVTWSSVSGPGTVTFGNASSVDTTATFSAAGTYVLQLTASDGSLSANDSITVTVQAAGDGTRYLTPGTGFTGATPEPSPVGSGAGVDAKAIARWDVVPFQTFSGEFNIGVIAFHINGISRVEFSVNGGPWNAIATMSNNPQVNVWEYWATVRAADFADGQIELRAVAYPVVGIPRVLESLYLFANAGGTQIGGTLYVSLSGNDTSGNGSEGNPFLSVKRALEAIAGNLAAYDGGTIVLKDAGSYDIDSPSSRPDSNARWITIRPANGLARDQVIIAPAVTELVRPYTRRLRFYNLSFDFNKISQMYKEDIHWQWYDNCKWYLSGGWLQEGVDQPVRNYVWGHLFVTDSLAYDSLYGFVFCDMVRGCHLEKISGDAYQMSRLVVNCTSNIIGGSGLGHHADVHQYWGGEGSYGGPQENVIVYGVKHNNVNSTQNIFLGFDGLSENFAFVNIAVLNNQNPSDAPFCQLQNRMNHFLFMNISNPRQLWVFRDDMAAPSTFVGSNILFADCAMETLQRGVYTWTGLPSGVTARNCHFIQGELHGASPTTGAVSLIDGTGPAFTYSGSGASQLIGSGWIMPGFLRWDWDPSGSTAPNRGAFPFRP